MAKARKAIAQRRPSAARAIRTAVLAATRKGAWLYHGNSVHQRWKVDGPHFLGHTISHLALDSRDRCTLLAAAKTGHLGPTVFRSTDMGKTWKEAAQPPAFAKAPAGEQGRSVDHTFWLTPAHADEPNVRYAGTSPPGLFRSEGKKWSCVARHLPEIYAAEAARL